MPDGPQYQIPSTDTSCKGPAGQASHLRCTAQRPTSMNIDIGCLHTTTVSFFFSSPPRMLRHLTRRRTPRLLGHGHGHNVLDSLVHQPVPPGWQACQRCLHLSTTDPIKISNDRKSITFNLATGQIITQPFRPTPKISSEKLERALSPLLSDSGPEDAPSESRTTNTETWQLDPQGDAIHRHFLFPSEQAREHAVELIMRAADDMKHHPHVARGGGEGRSPCCLTVTCTTHQPTGLSGKDARLAAKISELLLTTTTARDEHWSIQRILEEQAKLVRINRDAITQALESCGCSAAKGVS